MSSHEYKGHAIRVEARPGAARPWGVWVDGVELFGSGDRVRRRLAYGTAAAALDAGKRHVRALLGALPCAECQHPKAEHNARRRKVLSFGGAASEADMSGVCGHGDCKCLGYKHAGSPFTRAMQDEAARHLGSLGERLERIKADASERLSKLQPRPVEVGSAAHRLTQAVSAMLAPVRELEQAAAVGKRKPLPISPAAAAQQCNCGHRRDAHTIPYETNLSMRCAVDGCACFEFAWGRA